MKQSKSARGGSKIRSTRPPPRVSERNCDGVYCNNYFMHAATSHVGNLVKVETVQGIVYEGIFKTFSEHFEVVLELAHKVDTTNPQKVNVQEVVDNLIFRPKDIVYICAQNTEPDFAVKSGSFQTDTNISKYNGDISGEKKLMPWEGPPVCNGEECDLETSDLNQNGWDVHDMFLKNEQFGVQTSYDDSLSDYTCQIRKDAKDFRDDEAKAARIAMEIERNPSSVTRANLENGENEEDMFAAVARPGAANEKYVPPMMKRKGAQHHRAEGGGRGGGGGGRGQYATNGNQRSYNVPESPGRQQQMNNNQAPLLPRYHQSLQQQQQQQQQHTQYHQQPPPSQGQNSQTIRDSSSRSPPENKNVPMGGGGGAPPPPQHPQNIPTYTTTGGMQLGPQQQQQRGGYGSNVPPPPPSSNQQPKPQRTSPIAGIANGNAEYQSKQQLVSNTQLTAPGQQYHSQPPPPNSGANMQRKHNHPHSASSHHHHAHPKVREDQINELKKFGSDFNLPYDVKSKEQNEAPKQIQVVTSRNKSPPMSQQQQGPVTAPERNVAPVTIVNTLSPPGGHYANVVAPAPGAVQPQQQSQQPVTTAPPPHTVSQPTPVPLTSLPLAKHPAHVLPQPPPPFQPVPHQQPLHLQQRDSQPTPVMIPHPGIAPPPPHLGPPHHSQQPILPPKQSVTGQHKPGLPMHQSGPPPSVLSATQTQTPPVQPPPPHPVSTVAQQTKTVINTQQMAHQNGQQQQQPSAGGVHHPQQRSVLQQQQQPPTSKGQSQAATQSNSQSLTTQTESNAAGQHETDGPAKMTKDDEDTLDDVSTTLKKSTLNPNAKEFVYNPTPKSFTPVSRSPSTPTQSRPHTPQTPSNYNIHPANAPVATGIQMVMPTYVVAASPAGYVPQPPTTSRLRKMPVNSHRTPEFHPSNIPASAVTGQPLLAPSITVAPSPLGHGTSFPVPAYPHHPQLAAQHYPVQMLRMVQQGSVVPLVPSSIGYHETAGGSNAATAVYVNHGSGAAMAMAPHTPHVHHAPQPHPPPSTAPSPSQTPQGPSQSHTPNNYQHPSLATQNAPPYQPIVCPVIQAPPNHGPPHQMVAAHAQAHGMQQYLQHQQVTQQPHIQVSLIPHTS